MVPDYYEILGVDPRADRAAIEEAIARCQPKWSAGARNPKHRHTYQSYLDQIPAIRQALLGDPSARAAYDAERDADRRAHLDRVLDELGRLVRLRAAKGGLTVSDRDRLRREAGRLGIDPAELDPLLEPIPPLPEAPPEPEDEPDAPVDAIDSATRGQIRRTLEHLGRRDLYDALGLPRDAPQSEIEAKADAERQRWRQKSRVTAEMTAWLEAVSYAQSHLGTPEARARYDRTLELEAEERFREVVAFCLDGEGRLANGTKSALVDEATALGIGPDRADRLIRRACKRLGVAIGGAEPGPTFEHGPIRLLRCRECRGVTTRDDAERNGQSCRHCGASLRWECPVCRREHWVDAPRCACGFRLELREPMLRHFEAAQRAHRARDYASAMAHLHRIQEFAPDHPGTRKAVEKVKERLAEIEDARAAFEQELARRHLMAAQSALRNWAKLVDPAAPELRTAAAEVHRGLREARTLAARAASLVGTDPTEARAHYRRALEWAADLPEARDGLRRCPPDPPTGLKVHAEGMAVRLRWNPPTPDGLGPLTFIVVRKRDGLPRTPTDGEVVAETTSTECHDPGAAPGQVVGYAAFSRRDGNASIAAATAGPALILADVTDLRVEAHRGEVDLGWRLPANAVGARVLRKHGSPPAGPEDGTPIESMPEGACDRGLDDDRVYHYGIYAAYKAPDGSTRYARGVTVAAMPQAPAAGVEALELGPMPDGGVRIGWTAPDRGQVAILRTDRNPGLAEGRRMSPAEADALDGDRLPILATDHTVDPRPPSGGLCYYTPLTTRAGTVTVGRTAAYSRVPDPSDLRAVRIGGTGRVHLRWRWAPPCTRAVVVARAGGPPDGPDDPDAFRVEVTELDYSNRGFLPLDLPGGGPSPFHLTVFGIAEVDDRRVYSPGLEPTARTVVPGPLPEVSLSYAIKRPLLPGRGWTVTLRTDPPNSPVPPLVLVGHPRTIPLSADDGEILDRVPAGRDGDSLRLNLNHRASVLNLRIFPDPTAPPQELLPIRLRHPEAERTRV